MRGLVLVIFGLLAYITFRVVVMLFYMPVLEFVAERVERRVLGRAIEDPKRWYQMIGRMGLIVAVTLVLSMTLALLSLAASFIPVVGTVVVMLGILPLQWFLAAVGYLDPSLDRRGYAVRASLRMLRSRFFTVVLFDLIGTAILLVPLVGWFLGPTYSVVAGIILVIRMLGEMPAKPQLDGGGGAP